MKGLKSILAVLAAMTMTIGAVSIKAYAEDAPETAAVGTEAENSGKDISEKYTLEQLFAMSDDEFSLLRGRYCRGEDYCNSIYGYAVYDRKGGRYSELPGLSGTLYKQLNDTSSEVLYQKGITEEALKSLLGDTVKYSVSSPSFKDNMYYSYRFSVHFPDYETHELMNDDDERLMEFAKCWYCVDQVLDCDYYSNSMAVNDENHVNAPTLKGDADLSGAVDLADLTTLAKYNLSNEAYPLKNSTAYANADMNDDGKVDGLDTSALIENQLGRSSDATKKKYTFEDFLNMSEDEVKAAFAENGMENKPNDHIKYRVWTADRIEKENERAYVRLDPKPYMINRTDHELITRSENDDDLFHGYEFSWDKAKIMKSLALPQKYFTVYTDTLNMSEGGSDPDGKFYYRRYYQCFISCNAWDGNSAKLLAAALNFVQFNPDFKGFHMDYAGA